MDELEIRFAPVILTSGQDRAFFNDACREVGAEIRRMDPAVAPFSFELVMNGCGLRVEEVTETPNADPTKIADTTVMFANPNGIRVLVSWGAESTWYSVRVD